MPGFLTDTELKPSVVKAALHKGISDIAGDVWDAAIADANQAAYDLILVHFLELGYTVAQIATWGQGTTFQRYLARYQALIDAAGDSGDQTSEWRKELDYWRGKLDELTTLTTTTAVVEPGDSEGSVGHGDLSTTTDLFVMDPDDENRGEVTEW